jgi:hypothetical protein
MMNKIIGGIAVLALVLSIIGLVGNKQPVPVPFGGITNFDQLSLDATSLPQLAIASTTPATNASVIIDGTGTTTLSISSATAAKGGCLQMENTAGTITALYISGTTVVATAGTCR